MTNKAQGGGKPPTGWGGKRPGAGPKSNEDRGVFSRSVKLHFASEEEYRAFMVLTPRQRVVFALRAKQTPHNKSLEPR